MASEGDITMLRREDCVILHPLLSPSGVTHLLFVTTSSINNNADSVCLFPSKPNNTTAWISWLHIQRHTQTHWLHNCHQNHQPSYFQVSHRAFIASAALLTPCPSCLLTHSLLAMKSSDCPFIVGCFWVTLGLHVLPCASERGSNQPPSQVLIWCNGSLITVYPFNESALC